MAIKIDIKKRNRIIINGDGQRLNRIKGSVDPNYQVASPNMGNYPTENRPAEGAGEEEEKETV